MMRQQSARFILTYRRSILSFKQLLQYRIMSSLLSKTQLYISNLKLLGLKNLSADDICEDLAAQTDAQYWSAYLDVVFQKSFLGLQIWIQLGLIRALMAS